MSLTLPKERNSSFARKVNWIEEKRKKELIKGIGKLGEDYRPNW